MGQRGRGRQGVEYDWVLCCLKPKRMGNETDLINA